jgi:hypothetical protein
VAQRNNDPEFQKTLKGVTDKNPGLTKQQKFYRAQRISDENKEKRGGSDAVTREAATIHKKAGMKLTGREADLTQKPGASPGEQMANVAMVGGGLGDAASLIGLGRSALGASVPRAVEGVARKALGRGAGQVAKRTIPGVGPRVVGKTTVEDIGRTASRRALPAGKAELPRGAPKRTMRTDAAKVTRPKSGPRGSGRTPRELNRSPRQRKYVAENTKTARTSTGRTIKTVKGKLPGKKKS